MILQSINFYSREKKKESCFTLEAFSANVAQTAAAATAGNAAAIMFQATISLVISYNCFKIV